MSYQWDIILRLASIVSAIASSIAAYFAVVCRPKKVKELSVEIENVIPMEDGKWRTITFSVGNLDHNTSIEDAMVSIEFYAIVNLHNIQLKYAGPERGAGGMLYASNVLIEDRSLNFSINKMKPRTRQTFSIRFSAEPGDYEFVWYAHGVNLKNQTGKLYLKI